MVTLSDSFSKSLPQLRQLARNALLAGAKEYAGKAAGGVTGGTGGGGDTPNYFGRRFTDRNTHHFAPLSDRPRFIVVQRKDGKWVGFNADGYATAKAKKFGKKPILIATGKMVRDLRDLALTKLEGDRALVTFKLSDIATRHYTGTDRMPKRDPVTPNDADRAAYRQRVEIIYRQLLARWRAAKR
jgi:hypothetical protein